MTTETEQVQRGDGYAVAGSLDAMGDGYGFRKVRRALDVTAFGVNALVVPAGFFAPPHYHERQEELYFVHRGEMQIDFTDGRSYLLGEGGCARVDASTVRRIGNPSSEDGVYLVVGGADGYVGRDGRAVEDGRKTSR